MTNAELIQKIRNEIERRKGYISVTHFSEDLLSFLSTLESEKPTEGLEEELDRFIASGKSVTVEDCGTYKVSYHDFKKVARHFAEWQKEQMMKIITKDDNLEEAGAQYIKTHFRDIDWTPDVIKSCLEEAFISGGEYVFKQIKYEQN